uniref:Trafficking protein particle complex subunit n=1 Tax=Alexandrium monilatum TaxID=311494 RepID=A0A7S4S5I9_9DINO|mmetsp:Transcript_25562/g.76232  ORF Transcript_25562/g.76232 Transcript_25562/m.76232 type:complete len:150 (+) Transcript_25562:184-633(+)
MASVRSVTTRAAPATVNVLIIVGKEDHPIYEADLSSSGYREDSPHLDQFVIHAALDVVDEVVWTTGSMFLRVVDEFDIFLVSAYCTAGHVRFMLLHKNRNEDAIRAFFNELHDLYIKAVMSPFYKPNSWIESPAFDQRVRLAAKRHFRV